MGKMSMYDKIVLDNQKKHKIKKTGNKKRENLHLDV